MKVIRLIIICLIALNFYSCNKDKNKPYHPVPYVYVYRQINMDFPQYINLNNLGGHVYLDGEGFKGIVVIHDYSDQYYAMDRACTYHPTDTCAQVTMDKGGLSLKCGHYSGQDFVNCCGSEFSLDGAVFKNPATYPLRRYNVSKQENTLIISN